MADFDVPNYVRAALEAGIDPAEIAAEVGRQRELAAAQPVAAEPAPAASGLVAQPSAAPQVRDPFATAPGQGYSVPNPQDLLRQLPQPVPGQMGTSPALPVPNSAIPNAVFGGIAPYADYLLPAVLGAGGLGLAAKGVGAYQRYQDRKLDLDLKRAHLEAYQKVLNPTVPQAAPAPAAVPPAPVAPVDRTARAQALSAGFPGAPAAPTAPGAPASPLAQFEELFAQAQQQRAAAPSGPVEPTLAPEPAPVTLEERAAVMRTMPRTPAPEVPAAPIAQAPAPVAQAPVVETAPVVEEPVIKGAAGEAVKPKRGRPAGAPNFTPEQRKLIEGAKKVEAGRNWLLNMLGNDPVAYEQYVNAFNKGQDYPDYKSAVQSINDNLGGPKKSDFKTAKQGKPAGTLKAVPPTQQGLATLPGMLNLGLNALGGLGLLQAYRQGQQTGDYSDFGLGAIGQVLGNIAPRAGIATSLMAPRALNQGEAEELAKRRQKPATID